MTYVPLLLTLLAVDLLAVISPGPNFVVVMETAVAQRSRGAAAVVLGIVTGGVIWCLVVALGLSAVFAIWPWVYGAMKFFGGAYLIYLGVMAWRSKGGAPAHVEAGVGSSSSRSVASSYFRGLVTTLTNPKSVVYFGSIFALFLKPNTPLWVQASAVGIVMVDALLWYGAVAALFSSRAVQRIYARIEGWIRRVTGAVMIGFGARLILAKD